MADISTTPSTNGHTNRIRLAPKSSVKASKAPTKAQQRRSSDLRSLRSWATSGICLMAGLSAGLNGYANSQHATVAWAGWGMGLVIPAIVLVLGKVGSLLWRCKWRLGARAIGVVGVGLLFLSVWHFLATSIALLTGSAMMLALPMAVAIDCGLVGCELKRPSGPTRRRGSCGPY